MSWWRGCHRDSSSRATEEKIIPRSHRQAAAGVVVAAARVTAEIQAVGEVAMAVVRQAIAATLVVALEEATVVMLHEMSVITAAEGAIGRGSERIRSVTKSYMPLSVSLGTG
jgi:hypothetical protein